MEVELTSIPVMYVVSPTGPAGAELAFKKLEDAINWQLKGRKFYGTMMGKSGEYRSCMGILEGDDPAKLGLQTWSISGGKYYREKINDWQKHVSELGTKCDEIIGKVEYDNSRPIIEFYRSLTELLLHIPIK